MDRLVFYSRNDSPLGWQGKRIGKLIDDCQSWDEYNNISDIMELYHLKKTMDSIVRPKDITEKEWNNYNEAVKKVPAVVARFFQHINDESLEIIIDAMDSLYRESFWELFINQKGNKRISEETISSLLNNEKINIIHLLENKEVTRAYGQIVREYLLENPCYARELVSEYLSEKTVDHLYYFPKELTDEDKIAIIDKYIDAPDARLSDLELLSYANSDQLRLSAKTKLRARKKYQEKIESYMKTGNTIKYGVEVLFDNQKEPLIVRTEGNLNCFIYSINWVLDNLDYPTLFNNFIYLFEYVDFQFRWQSVSKSSMFSVLERVMGIKGKRDYLLSTTQQYIERTEHIQLISYAILLKNNGVFIEDMIKWFFETYLPEEFNAHGFIYNASQDNDGILSKCRNIAIEIDSVLKQFNLYCEEGRVDRELFELGTGGMHISSVASLLQDKYLYGEGATIRQIMNLLFSDQSLMLYTSDKYETPYKTLLHGQVNYNNLEDFQQNNVDFLIDKEILSLDKEKNICYSTTLLRLMYDLYSNEVVCTFYWNSCSKEISFLRNHEMVAFQSSLLSVPEQKYFNYIINKSEYDNSRELRNKYAHGNQSLNESQMNDDYYTMLRIMILVIIKINEEMVLNAYNNHKKPTNEE